MAKKLFCLGLSAASTAALLLLTPAPVMAQAQAPSAGSGIEEVVVTAERRSEVLSRVPASISAFTADRIDQLNVKDFSDLVKYTPGVSFDTETDNISIRGVNSSAGDATTGIYIDDTPIQLRTLGFGSDNTLPAVFDLARVEVLRGPQGTLFGAGSEGGTVRYITPQPSLTDFSIFAKSEVSFTQGGAPSYEAGAAVGGPIVEDALGFRASAWYRRDGGWIDLVNYLNGSTIDKNTNRGGTFAGRLAFGWQPTADLVITPSVFFQDRMIHNNDLYWVSLSNPDSGRYINATPDLMGDKDHFTLPAVKLDWTPGPFEIVSNTSYFSRHQSVQDYSGSLYNLSYFQSVLDPSQPGGPEDPWGRTCHNPTVPKPCPFRGGLYPLLTATGFNLPGFPYYNSRNFITNTQENFTQEIRVQSSDPDARLAWVFGGFWTRQAQLSVERINDPQLPALTQYLWGETLLRAWGENLLPNGDDYINHTNGHERQMAAFGNATFAIIPSVKIQVGARYAISHFDFTNFSDGAQNFGPLTGNKGSQDEKPFTPMGGITWQINDDDMVYATAAKGYRIGGANPPVPYAACKADLQELGITSLPDDYASDTVTSYEAGTKDKFFDGRLQASGSLFYLKWRNIQQDNYLQGCGFKYTTNLGNAESKGFDLEGEFLVTDALDVDFSAGYIDAHFTTNAATGSAPDAPTLAWKGDKLPGSPWTFSVGAQYTATVFDRDSFIRAEYELQSRETGLLPALDPRNSAAIYDPALEGEPETDIMTLRAGTTFDNMQATLFIDNLLDSHPRLDLQHQDAATLLFEASTLRPRTFGLTVTYRQ